MVHVGGRASVVDNPDNCFNKQINTVTMPIASENIRPCVTENAYDGVSVRVLFEQYVE